MLDGCVKKLFEDEFEDGSKDNSEGGLNSSAGDNVALCDDTHISRLMDTPSSSPQVKTSCVKGEEGRYTWYKVPTCLSCQHVITNTTHRYTCCPVANIL